MEHKITAGTIARTIVLLLALVNQCLSMAGIQVIPIADEDINTLVTTLWTVVGVLIALVGLGASITKLVERVERELAQQAAHSQESHWRLWAHNDAQDQRLDDHEKRISILEKR